MAEKTGSSKDKTVPVEGKKYSPNSPKGGPTTDEMKKWGSGVARAKYQGKVG